MLIIAIIVLSSSQMHAIVLFFDADCCMIGLLYCSADGPQPYSFYCV
jgi:hypothetical protein